MPLQLLPASAAAFAPRSAPTIVLGSRVEQWLTQTLKRVNRIKRPLNSVPQHFRCLTETLGGPSAIWTLSSIMLPKAPASELRQDPNPLLEALSNYQLIHVEAYVVHVDMVSQHEVAFKLTSDTIDALVEYHRDIYSVDAAANSYPWPEKESQVKKMQEEFVQSVNRFVFRTGVRALEGLEDDGAGELLDGRSDEAKRAVLNLFVPLLPPPPQVVDVVAPPLFVNNSYGPGGWWPPVTMNLLSAPIDTWRVLPSTPSPTTSSSGSVPGPAFWNTMVMAAAQSTPAVTSLQQPAFTSSSNMYDPPSAISALSVMPYPSALPCGTSMTNSGIDGFGWSNATFTPQYAAI